MQNLRKQKGSSWLDGDQGTAGSKALVSREETEGPTEVSTADKLRPHPGG